MTILRKGFTIIEVLFIVVVMAIIAAIVIPRVGRGGLFDKLNVYTTAHQITADMRLARRLAVTTGSNHRVKFYKVNGSSDYNQYKLEKNGGGWTVVGETKDIPDEIVVTIDGEVEFEPAGTATDKQEFRYKIGNYQYKITVKKETGRVKLEED